MPVPVSAAETLADAVCCDTRTKAERLVGWTCPAWQHGAPKTKGKTNIAGWKIMEIHHF